MNFRSLTSRGTCVLLGVVLAFAMVAFFANTAMADPINPGFDYFFTPPGGTSVNLGPLGIVPLMGVPLPDSTGGIDTIVARMDPGPPPGGTGLIDIELVALHLMSVAPVDLTPVGGPPAADLHVTIDASDRFYTGIAPHPDGSGLGPSRFNLPTVPNLPSIGNMEMMHEGPAPHPNPAASMDACMGTPAGCAAMPSGFGAGLGVPGGGIYASLFFTIPGGNPANPADLIPGVPPMPAPPITLASTGVYEETSQPALGGIRLTFTHHDGPHPSQIPPPGSGIIPEPSSVLLALVGVFGLFGCARRRKA